MFVFLHVTSFFFVKIKENTVDDDDVKRKYARARTRSRGRALHVQ